MKNPITKALAIAGVCTLFAAAGNAASAQGYNHFDRHIDRHVSREVIVRHDAPVGFSDSFWFRGSGYRRDARYLHASSAERRRLDRLHEEYIRDAANGHYAAAERAHLHAQALRADLRHDRR